MPILDAVKVAVHFNGTHATWSSEMLRSTEETAIDVDWDDPAVLDSLRVLFGCKDGETVKTVEFGQNGVRGYLMKLDGSPVDEHVEPPKKKSKQSKG